jgi:CMP-N-acetylneuraminate monooxygenase
MKINLGKILTNKRKSYIQRINLPKNEGFFQTEDLIIGKVNEVWLAYDRICDHNGGTLYIDKNKKTATCPIHKWTLKLADGKYENSCTKKTYKVNHVENFLEIERYNYEFNESNSEDLIDKAINIDFNAHASVTLNIGNVKITTDPWFIGSCFATGWWHTNPPSEEAEKRLKESHFIYISHNHPDHLHLPTLNKYVDRNTPIIVPNFESKSVENILISNGYINLIIAEFLQEIDIEASNGKFRVTIIKSGDNRDDSSLLLQTRNNKIFLGVDANMPNKWVLPKVDLLYTPFAGGASGFPSRIENFGLERKKEIVEGNRFSILNNHVKKLVSATKPKYIVPYAGYFTENTRDIEVKQINRKNSPDELIAYVESEFEGVKGINPLTNSHISLYKDEFITKAIDETPSYFLDEEYVKDQIIEFSGTEWAITDLYLKELAEKFLNSSFKDDLTVVILPSSDDFNCLVSKALSIDFSVSSRSFQIIECENDNISIVGKLKNPNNNNIELLKIRASSLVGAFRRGMPLEDLSIGFQIKMFRIPNVYNFKFWNHFTNNELIKIENFDFED